MILTRSFLPGRQQAGVLASHLSPRPQNENHVVLPCETSINIAPCPKLRVAYGRCKHWSCLVSQQACGSSVRHDHFRSSATRIRGEGKTSPLGSFRSQRKQIRQLLTHYRMAALPRMQCSGNNMHAKMHLMCLTVKERVYRRFRVHTPPHTAR